MENTLRKLGLKTSSATTSIHETPPVAVLMNALRALADVNANDCFVSMIIQLWDFPVTSANEILAKANRNKTSAYEELTRFRGIYLI